MDELTAALAGSFQVTNRPNNPDAPHPRFAQYKSKGYTPDQQKRRHAILEHQKKSRFDALSHIRRLAEDIWDDMEEEEEVEEEEEQMDTETRRYKRPGRRYRNQLMLSEWLVEVPGDFENEWVMKACPVGKRSLVVTSRGKTTAYAKSGYRVNSFQSHLPGGKGGGGGRECTILDCIYSEVDRTYYILDLMCWKGHPLYDTETEFRFFWLEGKKQETPEMEEISKRNAFRFVPLPSFTCDKASIEAALAATSNVKLDGLLFYHKRTHYLFGDTPLVLWLKPYMLPEILGVSIPNHLSQEAPSSYTNFAGHVEQVKKDKELAALKKNSPKGKYHGQKGRHSKGSSEGGMEVSQQEGENNEEDTGDMDTSNPSSKGKRNRRRNKQKGQSMEVQESNVENVEEGDKENQGDG